MKERKVFYGWYVVIGCLLITCTLVPPIMALSSKFLMQVTEELQISRSAFTLANTILQGLGIFLSPFVSAKLAKGDMKKIQTISIAGFAVSYASYSLAQNVVHLYISSIFIGIFYLNATLIPVSMMITNWFTKKRGLAMSIAMAGIGIGGAVFSPIVTALLTRYGWRHTYQIMAVIMLVIALPAAIFLLKKRPEEMGLKPERSHHEHGPGQNEIDFRCSSPLKAADDLMTFKTAVKAIAQQHGLFASFLPKPLKNESGSGLHINLSLYEDNENLFEKQDSKAMSFMAGVLRRMREMTAFANPLVSSYERFGQFEAPSAVSWSHQNRSTLVRIPYAEGHDCRMEVRSPDPAANPYLLISLLISAGMSGIADGLAAEPEATGDVHSFPPSKRLPASLAEALAEAGRSGFVRQVIPERIVNGYVEDRAAEIAEYDASGADHDCLFRRYLRII